MSSEFEKFATTLYVEVGDVAEEKLRVLFYEPEGEIRDTLVLIPGYGSLPSAYDKFLLEMKKNYKIYIIETREKYTAKLGKKPDYTENRFAKDIAEVIDFLKLDDYFLVASSMGGAIILRALSMKFIAPRITYLIGPVLRLEIPSFTWPFVYLATPPIWRFILKPIAKFYIKYIYLDRTQKDQIKKYFGYFDNYNMKRIRKSMITKRKFLVTEEELKAIESKCILIGAEKDKAHAAEITLGIAESIKNSDYYDLETNVAAHSKPLKELIEETLDK
ncbi:MAG: alpha/beta hydrolase [Candidatus Heimdallarchaeota archaeon]